MDDFKSIIESGQFYEDPFPHLIVPNFFSKTECESAFKSISESQDYDDDVMGGRNRIVKGGTLFEEILDNSLPLREFYLQMNQEKTFNFLDYIFKQKMKHYQKPCYTFMDNGNCEFLPSHSSYSRDTRTSKLGSLANGVLSRIKHELFKNFDYRSPQHIYFDCDFSISRKGYSREPHHDNPHRIINFILYFNTIQNDLGGALEFFQYKKSNKVFLSRQPNANHLELIKVLPPAAGTLVVFLSTPHSIHGVSLLNGESTRRVFSYGSFSLNGSVKWKRSSSSSSV
jgi:Rps23 Pro-64 3,4-dihydroxylase Tpa1-like proline 4-hydroxylase